MEWNEPDPFGIVSASITTPIAERIIELFPPSSDSRFCHPIYWTVYIDGDRAELCKTLVEAKETGEAFIRGEIGISGA